LYLEKQQKQEETTLLLEGGNYGGIEKEKRKWPITSITRPNQQSFEKKENEKKSLQEELAESLQAETRIRISGRLQHEKTLVAQAKKVFLTIHLMISLRPE